MTDWHVNEGLAPLIAQMKKVHPGIVIGTIGDAAHRAEKSDHNPNAAGRVNAADFMLGSTFNEDQANALLPWLIKDGRTHYVIHDRQIWTTETRAWLRYNGTDPHTNHIHLSVVDSAYHNSGPWTIAPPAAQEDNMPDATDIWGVQIPLQKPTETAAGALWDIHQRVPDLSNFLPALAGLADSINKMSDKIDQLLAKQGQS